MPHRLLCHALLLASQLCSILQLLSRFVLRLPANTSSLTYERQFACLLTDRVRNNFTVEFKDFNLPQTCIKHKIIASNYTYQVLGTASEEYSHKKGGTKAGEKTKETFVLFMVLVCGEEGVSVYVSRVISFQLKRTQVVLLNLSVA